LSIGQSPTAIANVVSALTARTQFGQILKRATQKNERFYRRPARRARVVINERSDYLKAFAPAPEE